MPGSYLQMLWTAAAEVPSMVFWRPVVWAGVVSAPLVLVVAVRSFRSAARRTPAHGAPLHLTLVWALGLLAAAQVGVASPVPTHRWVDGPPYYAIHGLVWWTQELAPATVLGLGALAVLVVASFGSELGWVSRVPTRARMLLLIAVAWTWTHVLLAIAGATVLHAAGWAYAFGAGMVTNLNWALMTIALEVPSWIVVAVAVIPIRRPQRDDAVNGG